MQLKEKRVGEPKCANSYFFCYFILDGNNNTIQYTYTRFISGIKKKKELGAVQLFFQYIGEINENHREVFLISTTYYTLGTFLVQLLLD